MAYNQSLINYLMRTITPRSKLTISVLVNMLTRRRSIELLSTLAQLVNHHLPSELDVMIIRFVSSYTASSVVRHVLKTKKHPGRRPIVKCQTADYDTSSKKRGDFKEAILEVCRKRADKQSEDVKLRVLSATCDLHAADAVYHRDCRCTFMPTSALTRVAQKNTQESTNQKVFDGVVHTMESDQSRVWTSMEVYKFYLDNGGDRDAMNNRKLVQSLSDVMGNKLLVLQNPGLASMLMFRAKAAEMVKLVEDTSDSLDLKPVAKQIVNECKSLESDECKSTYNPRIISNVVKADCSQTLLDLLSLISPKLDGLPGYFIGNIISCIVCNQCTSLLLALGVLVRDKALISVLSNFLITCNYDELLRFRTSVAHDAANKYKFSI